MNKPKYTPWFGSPGTVATVDLGADVVAPSLVSAVVPTDGLTLALTYNEALNAASVPGAGAFALGGTVRTVSSVAVLGAVVTLTLSGAIAQGATVTVSYTPGGSPIEDVAGNNAAALVAQAVTNGSTVPEVDLTPPTLSSAVVAADGLTIALTYNETLGASTPSPNDYTIAGTPAVIASVGRVGAVVTLTLSQPAVVGQVITLSYTPGVNPVRDVAGNNASALVAQAVTNGSAATYTAPTVPVTAKCGYFLIGDDIADAATWAPRKDIFSQGHPVITGGAVNASGWPTPEGARKSMTLGGAAYLRMNALAAMAAGDDPNLEVVLFYKVNVANNPSTLAAWSNSTAGQTTPKRVIQFTTAGYRVTNQSTLAAFTHNATNLLQQMVRVRWKNNGAGNDLNVWRNEEPDPAGTLTQNVGAQAVNTFTIGAHDNGSTLTSFANMELFAVWVRDPAAAELTDDEALEIHNFMLGAYSVQPLYTSATPIFLLANFGQSNSLAQGLATGAVAGLPDAQVKEMMRAVNNTAVDPVGLTSLNLRGSVHGAQHYIKRGSFAKLHHMIGVGKGATNAGSDWGGQNGVGPTNSLQGLYSTSLPSECRRNIFLAKARFGGAPSVQWTWMQGENDAAAGSVVAGQYGANLGAIKTYLRSYIQRAFGVSNAVGHLIKLNRTLQTGGGIVQADLDTINAAIDTQVSGDVNLRAVTAWSALTDPGNVLVDNLHMSAVGAAALGAGVIASVKAADGTL